MVNFLRHPYLRCIYHRHVLQMYDSNTRFFCNLYKNGYFRRASVGCSFWSFAIQIHFLVTNLVYIDANVQILQSLLEKNGS